MTDTRQVEPIVMQTTSSNVRHHRISKSMWFITAAWGCLLLGASLVWPMTYGYDEEPHVDMAYAYAARPFHFYEPGTLTISDAALGIYKWVPGHPPRRRLADVPVLPRNERPNMTDLGGHRVSSMHKNQMAQHPPLYYEMAALVMRVPGVSHLAWDMQIWLMRLLSIVLMMPVPLLSWAAARRILPASLPRGTPSSTIDRLAIAAAVIPLTVPNLIRVGSSVTNDALLISATSLLLYLLCRVVTSDLTAKTAVYVAASLAAALLTKGFALVLPPVVLAAYVVGWLRQKPPEGRRAMALWRPLAISAVGGVVGGLWWLRNLVLYGAIEPLGGPLKTAEYGPPDLAGHVKRFVPRFTADFAARIWGGVGYADRPRVTSIVTFGFLALVLIGLALAVSARGLRGDRGSRWANLVLLAAPALTFFLAAWGSFSHYRHYVVSAAPRASQGRYIYDTIVIVATLATVGWFAVLRPRVRPLVAPLVLAAAALVNASVWIMLLRSWYAPIQHASFMKNALGGVHSLLRFSPLPSAVTILLTVLLPAVSCSAAMVAITRDARELSRPDDPAAHAEEHAPQIPAMSGELQAI